MASARLALTFGLTFVIRVLVRNNSSPNHTTYYTRKVRFQTKSKYICYENDKRRRTEHKQDRVEHMLDQDPKLLHHNIIINKGAGIPSRNSVRTQLQCKRL